jgi:hypothetical protein
VIELKSLEDNPRISSIARLEMGRRLSKASARGRIVSHLYKTRRTLASISEMPTVSIKN